MKANDGTRKLCLGTVQMGKNYGVANVLGRQPSAEESFSVLRLALEQGISYFDTASVYGASEQILGEFRLARNTEVHIISKFPPEQTDSEQAVLDELRSTLHRLGAASLDGYLLHDAKDMQRRKIVRGLCLAKEKRLVSFIGVSVYEPEDACAAVAESWVDYVQIPYNVMDQRLDETEFFSMARKNHVKVFARGMFLQGLLLMEPEVVPQNLREILPYLEKFRAISHEHGFSTRDAAFLFGLCHPGIDHVVFGVDTVEQLAENLEITEKQKDFSACYDALFGAFCGIDRRLINPSLWR